MKKIINFFICLFFIFKCFSQNLIPNHSFEDSLTTISWTTSMGICYNSPIIICRSTEGNINDAEHINFNVIDGNSCVYLSLFQCHTGWSDYLINKGFKLEKGKQYEFSFYITPSDSCGYYSKQIDVVFCRIDNLTKDLSCATPGKIFLTPAISFDISSFKQTDQEGKWKKLSYSFIAEGTENSFVIGRFFDSKKVRKIVTTRILTYKPTKTFLVENFCGADYYLDNFKLVENN